MEQPKTDCECAAACGDECENLPCLNPDPECRCGCTDPKCEGSLPSSIYLCWHCERKHGTEEGKQWRCAICRAPIRKNKPWQFVICHECKKRWLGLFAPKGNRRYWPVWYYEYVKDLEAERKRWRDKAQEFTPSLSWERDLEHWKREWEPESMEALEKELSTYPSDRGLDAAFQQVEEMGAAWWETADADEEKYYYDEGRLPEILARLTPRQRDIAEMILEGYNQSEIGERLGISQQAVSYHLITARDRFDGLYTPSSKPPKIPETPRLELFEPELDKTDPEALQIATLNPRSRRGPHLQDALNHACLDIGFVMRPIPKGKTRLEAFCKSCPSRAHDSCIWARVLPIWEKKGAKKKPDPTDRKDRYRIRQAKNALNAASLRNSGIWHEVEIETPQPVIKLAL